MTVKLHKKNRSGPKWPGNCPSEKALTLVAEFALS
jgi:hypothetical protein